MYRKISILHLFFCLFFVLTFIDGYLLSEEEENDCPLEALINSTVSNRTGELSEIMEDIENKTFECPCLTRYCLPMCCPNGTRFAGGQKCLPLIDPSTVKFPLIHDPLTLKLLPGEIIIQDYHVFTRDPCRGGEKYNLQPDTNTDDEFKFLSNGSIYLTNLDSLVDYKNFCFGALDDKSYSVILCFDDSPDYDVEISENDVTVALPVGMILSVPFLLLTFVVYTILPELRNMHGSTLRGYVGPLIIAYTVLAYIQISPQEKITNTMCILMAFIIHFSFLSSFFWLNVMCFDIWWTFGGFRSMQGSVKQREKKKFIIYSIYAWGSASLLTGVCLVMDFVPSIPKSFIRPEFGTGSCWFTSESAKALYFYGPIGVTVMCNICLFISTTIKIIQHKKDTAHHLKGMDSRRHDDNKQWFNLYLKLFIVMGINWSMEIISWLFKDSPKYVWYITDLANTLQGVIIFIIFVWKDKTKRLLLKRLGCQNGSFQSRNSTRSAYHSSASRTCTTTAVMAPLHEKSNPYTERTKTTTTTDESDCV